jgi:hypothetical protein
VLVSRQEFFDGNDDPASIGCNLMEHPGMEAFDAAFRAIEALPGVSGVYLAITELIDEEGMWPFTDTAFIVTSLSPDAFEQILAPLQPDEVERFSETFANSPKIPAKHRLIHVWWD